MYGVVNMCIWVFVAIDEGTFLAVNLFCSFTIFLEFSFFRHLWIKCLKQLYCDKVTGAIQKVIFKLISYSIESRNFKTRVFCMWWSFLFLLTIKIMSQGTKVTKTKRVNAKDLITSIYQVWPRAWTICP